jgi:hypothetical protein
MKEEMSELGPPARDKRDLWRERAERAEAKIRVLDEQLKARIEEALVQLPNGDHMTIGHLIESRSEWMKKAMDREKEIKKLADVRASFRALIDEP